MEGSLANQSLTALHPRSSMPAGEHGVKINRLEIGHSSRKSRYMAPAASTCRAECYRLWIRDPTSKLKHRDERQHQLSTSYNSFAGNVFLWHSDKNRQHLDADNRQQLGNRSARRILGAALLSTIEHRALDPFWHLALARFCAAFPNRLFSSYCFVSCRGSALRCCSPPAGPWPRNRFRRTSLDGRRGI